MHTSTHEHGRVRSVRTRAFTLVETMVVIAISTMVFIALVSILMHYGRTLETQSATIDVNVSANRVVNTIAPLVLQANAVATSYTLSGTTYTTSSTTLVLELPSIDASGAIISGAYDYAIFYASSSQAYERIVVSASSNRAAATKTLGTAIKSLSFTYDSVDVTSATSVTVDVRTEKVTRQETVSAHLTNQTHLRN